MGMGTVASYVTVKWQTLCVVVVYQRAICRHHDRRREQQARGDGRQYPCRETHTDPNHNQIVARRCDRAVRTSRHTPRRQDVQTGLGLGVSAL